MNKSILNYERACNLLVQDFAKKYYDGNDSWCWIGDDIGGVLGIDDEYLNMDLIISVMRLNPTVDEYFEYYYYQVEEHTEDRSPFKLEYWLHKKRK